MDEMERGAEKLWRRDPIPNQSIAGSALPANTMRSTGTLREKLFSAIRIHNRNEKTGLPLYRMRARSSAHKRSRFG
jgi:hypothetical protein